MVSPGTGVPGYLTPEERVQPQEEDDFPELELIEEEHEDPDKVRCQINMYGEKM
jgi:hypothetical protein